MAEIILNPCPICGSQIPYKPRVPMKTCSPTCRAERKRRIENARYQAEKDTPKWKQRRAESLATLRRKLASDPEFAAVFRAHSAASSRKWSEKVRAESPERYAATLAARRAERAAWRARLASDPAAWEQHKAQCRAWYAALPPAEKERIYQLPRKLRRQQQ
ncbi:hypothetical protein [Nevskia sp.]|uniref:hypothetical protein n=1 Tax=Nevskia sp. TaxID=1929292 RepID=UPI003F6F5F05